MVRIPMVGIPRWWRVSGRLRTAPVLERTVEHFQDFTDLETTCIYRYIKGKVYPVPSRLYPPVLQLILISEVKRRAERGGGARNFVEKE